MGHARAGVLRFLVSGYYGFGNAGDEAILAALVSGLRSEAARLPGQPEVDVVVLSGRPEETAADHGVRAIPRTDFVAVARAVAAADVVLSGGGSLLQDVTSHKNIPYYLAIVALGLAARRRTMAYAQGVGPVGSWAGRAAIRAVLDRVDLITTRDPHSAEFLRAIGVERPPIEVTADASLLLEPDRGFFVADALAAEGVNPDLPSPIIGLALRPWSNAAPAERLAVLAEALARELGAQVVLVPMQLPEDLVLAETVRASCRAPLAVLRRRYRPAQLLALLEVMDVVVGMRLHALVFAAICGVPPLGLSYDPKIDFFLRSLGWEAPLGAAELDVRRLVERADDAVRRRNQLSAALRRRVADLRAAARRNNELAVRLAAGLPIPHTAPSPSSAPRPPQ